MVPAALGTAYSLHCNSDGYKVVVVIHVEAWMEPTMGLKTDSAVYPCSSLVFQGVFDQMETDKVGVD